MNTFYRIIERTLGVIFLLGGARTLQTMPIGHASVPDCVTIVFSCFAFSLLWTTPGPEGEKP